MKILKTRRGAFSLIEVIIVLAILGLFAALVIPAARYIRVSTRTEAIQNQISAMYKVASTYMEDRGVKRVSLKTLIDDKLLSAPTVFMNENYEDFVFEQGGATAVLKTKDGDEIQVKY